MNLPSIFLILGLVILSFSITFFDDAFGSFRDSQNYIKIDQTNEYSNYVHFQPEWKSYPKNLIIDVSTSWERLIISGEDEISDISKHGAKQKKNILQYVNSKPVVVVNHDYMDCQSQWFHGVKTSLDFVGNHLELFLENKSIRNTQYSNESQKQKLQDGFAQFIPICTSKDSTNYKYSISINDKFIGFDVYFVPSYVQQWYYFLYSENFEYYLDEGCYGNNFQKFSGTCMNVDKNAGLLVVIPDDLKRPYTEISIKLTEI